MNVRQKCFRIAAVAIAMLATAGVCAQEAKEAEANQERSEAQAQRKKDEALRKMAAQVEAQQAELKAQRAALAAQREALQNESKVLFGERRTKDEAAASETQKLQKQLEAARQQLAAMQAMQAQMEATKQKNKAAPLPEDAELRVFTLRNSKLPEVTRVLAEIVGDRGMRIAMDERTNSLVVASNQETQRMVESLLQRLDEAPDKAALVSPLETFQLRIVWLLDGVAWGGRNPDRFVSPQVVEALGQLGFSNPHVVTQQVTTVTSGNDRRRGQFQFNVPVLISGQPWQFKGSGVLGSAGDNRYSLDIQLEYIHHPGSAAERGELSGSIFTPLGHYTVLGTTTFVASLATPDAAHAHDEAANVVTKVEPQKEYLSAFVVHLDRVKEFPDKVRRPTTAPARTSAE